MEQNRLSRWRHVAGAVVLWGAGAAFAATGFDPVPLKDVRVSGDLGHRVLLNYARLTGDYYRPEKLEKVSPDWPGDAVGREILALTLLGQATGTEPPTLRQLIGDVAAQLNERGYLGKVLPAGVENEQYLSGHSWLLRGLCEYQAWKKDDVSRSLVRRITAGLLLPAAGNYANYAVRVQDRPKEGGVAGNITREVNGWQLSSDVGCAFIMLDGATRAYELESSPELEAVIKAMIARYAQVDLAGVSAQTHATLSALRGILRFYASHPDPAYLDLVKRTYALYQEKATTEHYANYNWFNRPEWTEACAVVDAFMVATQLYGVTGEPRYLEDAQLVYYNALCHAQRPNGGFGCDICTGSSADAVVVKGHQIFEAAFCCSMRGAEGLTAAAAYTYLVKRPAQEGAPEVVVPFFHDNTATLRLGAGTLTLAESTAYPMEESVSVTVVESGVAGPVSVRFFVPSWVAGGSIRVTVNGTPVAAKVEDSFVTVTRPMAAGDQIQLQFDLPLRMAGPVHPALMPGRVRYCHGPLLLGRSLGPTTRPAGAGAPGHAPKPESFVRIGPATYRSTGPEPVTLSPLGDLTYRSADDAPAVSQELLFQR